MSPPAALSSPPEFGYVGCFKDCAAGLAGDPDCSASETRALPYFSGVVSTPESCHSACLTAGATYFALQSVDMECWCGDAPPRHAKVSDSECDASAGPGEACEGLAHGTCGGRWRNSVYAVSPLSLIHISEPTRPY